MDEREDFAERFRHMAISFSIWMVSATLFSVVIVPSLILITPASFPLIGDLILSGSQAQAPIDDEHYLPDNAPSLFAELEALGKDNFNTHEVLKDFNPRAIELQAEVGELTIISAAEYEGRGIVMVVARDPSGCDYTFVYRWYQSSRRWKFVQRTSFGC